MARLAVCAVIGFVWERERISDEEVLRCLRESEHRRGVPLTQSLNLSVVGKKKKKKRSDDEMQKRRRNVIRATAVVTQLPVSWNTVLVRQRQARQQQNTSPTTTDHTLHNNSSSSLHDATQHPLQSNSKINNSQASWWSMVTGYTLGAVYNTYNGVLNYFMPSNNDTSDNEEYCDPSNILTTDPMLLARRCLNRDEIVKPSPLLRDMLQIAQVTISKILDTMQHYTISPLPISLFEDALIAADYEGPSILPVGTLRWSPGQYSTDTTNDNNISHSEKCSNDWKLVHCADNTSLYVRPYINTELSQYRVVSRFSDISAVDFVDVQSNPSLRQRWDSYTGKMKIVDTDHVSNSEVLHWEVKFPFPLSNREYVFTRRSVVLPHAVVVLSRATDHPSVPPSRGCVRVDTYNSVMVVMADTSVDKDGFCFELIYVDDPKCNLPSSLSNWASTSGMMDYLAKVHSAALKKKEQKL